MEINRNNVNEIVKKANLKPDKDYGQNFLIETEVSKRIVDQLEVKKNDKILEIGPGLGSLSHFLIMKNEKTVLVDIDRRMIDFLLLIYKEFKHVEVVENDIRKTDLSQFTKILGNLPYNITTETVIYLLLNAVNAEKMVLMCQTEAFNRFYDLSGKDYGPASVLVHLLGESRKLFNVKPGCFYPAPKCSSTVFEININNDADRELAINTYKMCKVLFLNRRKTIFNNLANLLKNRDKAAKILKKSNIEENLRPEELNPNDFVIIYQEMIRKEE